MKESLSRRGFLTAVSAAAAGWGGTRAAPLYVRPTGRTDALPALLGGKPTRSSLFSSWPIVQNNDRSTLMKALESKVWNRGGIVERFEQEWASMLGARFVLATSSGTSALYCSLAGLDIGPGDEVVVPAYTFAATLNVVLMRHALPVFADTDRESLQMDASRLESVLSNRTRCVIPVHLGGNVCDMDRILEISRRHNLIVLEDACQAHLAEWRDRKVGTVGDLGCFSFQASKNLNSGEGGAISSQNEELMRQCASFHNVGRPYRIGESERLEVDRDAGFVYERCGDNRRLTELQGALLLSQLERLEEQTRIREANADYLDQLLAQIPGVTPARAYPGCTRNGYHLYMFRFDSEAFAGLPKRRFLEAMRAEGIPCSGGYNPLNQEAYLHKTLESSAYRRIYDEKTLRDWPERNQCPETRKLTEEAVWFSQTHLLGNHSDMEQIATAVQKIQINAEALKRG